MKVLLSVTVKTLEDKLNRQIKIDEDILVTDLFEFIIVSFNGKHAFGHNAWIYDSDDKLYVYNTFDDYENKSFKSLKLKKGNDMTLCYEYNEKFDFDIVVNNFLEDESNKDFEVLSGDGYGILDSVNCLHYFMTSRIDKAPKTIQDFLNKKFDVIETNKWVEEYKKHKEELLKPKKITLNVALEGFTKEIKRKIVVNSNINLDLFTRKIILSMNGDLSHDYGIKKGKNYISEIFFEKEFYFLDLKVKDRFKVIYDWGDNWIFEITIGKIEDGLNIHDFEVVSGCGYGIIDDCGGSWELEEVFNGNNDFWGTHDIYDFDLKLCNEKVINCKKF